MTQRLMGDVWCIDGRLHTLRVVGIIRHRALWAVSVYIVLARSARVRLQVLSLLSLHGFGLPGDLGTGLPLGEGFAAVGLEGLQGNPPLRPKLLP